MRYLTIEQVLFLHMRLIDETGGAHGIRDLGLLQAAVSRTQTAFADQDLYGDLPAKAAALMHSLVMDRAMVDGNKRVGVAAAGVFLAINGWELTAGNEEVESFTLRVAAGGVSHDAVTEWMRAHSRSR